MAATIADVAKKVGKSYQLVSAVLNGGKSRSAASDKTRDLILRAADQLGYRPNSAARAVSTGRFNAAGLLLSVSTWKSNITGSMLNGINRSLSADDMHLMVSGFPDETLTDETRLPKVLRHMLVDGLIIKYDCQVPPRMVELIKRCNLPIIWMNSKHEHDCVYPHDFGAARIATERLIELGHRAVAFADFAPRPEWDHYSNSDRLSGYLQAMKNTGLRAQNLNESTVPVEERARLAKSWLQSAARPTAVVAVSGDAAITIVYAASLAGLRIPEDLSVVAIEGRPVNAMGISVSTMLIPEEEMGFQAAELLRAKLSGAAELPPEALPFAFEPGFTCATPREYEKLPCRRLPRVRAKQDSERNS